MLNQLLTITLSFLSMICLGTAWFLAGRITKKVSPLQSLFLFQFIGIPFFIIFTPFAPISTSINNFGLILALGFCFAFVNLLLFHAYKIGNLSIVNPISDSYVVFTVIFGIILLHESITGNKIVGTILVFSGSILLSIQLSQLGKNRKINLNKGVIPAFFAGVGTGLYLVIVTILARQAGWLVNAFGIRLGISIMALAILLIKKNAVKSIFSKIPWQWVIPGAALDVIGFSIYNLAIINSEVSYVTIIISAQSLVIVLLSYIFLKERLTRYQILGLISIILGVIVVNL